MTINVNQQISELVTERAKRADVFPRLVRAGKMKQSEADYRNACLDAAIASLNYLRDNREVIIAAVKQAKDGAA